MCYAACEMELLILESLHDSVNIQILQLDQHSGEWADLAHFETVTER